MTGFTTDISGIRPRVSQSEIVKIITDSTSGTTGREKRVYYTEKDLNETVEVFKRGISEMKPRKTLICFPYTNEYSLGSLISRAVRGLGAEPVEAGTGRPYLELVRLTEKEKPDSFIGFPQMLLALQRLTGGCFENGLISGDYCINADYGCPVFPHYGSREMGLAGAISCCDRNGMHMRPDVWVEIVDTEGNPVEDGYEGELVITTSLEAMPLERYRTGDYTRIIPGPCPCGSGWTRIGNVRRKNPIEELDDRYFSDPELIDWRDGTFIHINDVDENTVPLFEGKRHI